MKQYKLMFLTKHISKGLEITALLGFSLLSGVTFGQATACDLQVSIGENQTICPGEEVTLNAVVSGTSDCEPTPCTTFEVSNTNYCLGKEEYVFYLSDRKKRSREFFENIDLVWSQPNDSTATLKGKVKGLKSGQILVLDLTYSGKTEAGNAVKEHECHTEDSSEWSIYPNLSGTVVSEDGSFSVELSPKGPSFQIGNGANVTEDTKGTYGASGWFMTTQDGLTGDVNILIQPCETPTPEPEPESLSKAAPTFVWSTGETTPSITVSPDKTTQYSVSVTGCNNCEASAEVVVTIPESESSQEICYGEQVELTAASGESYEWSTGETTQSIKVQVPFDNVPEKLEYIVKVVNENCELEQKMVIITKNCDELSRTIDDLNVYYAPNGSKAIQIGVHAQARQDIKYTVYAISGSQQKPLAKESVQTGDTMISLDVSQFPSGLYVLKVREENGMVSSKTFVVY